ncbi:MAG: hypothetical protein M5U34_20345 [Chloroflexi bacterium]|nr:hypothetical protein [Chloroflexota bacterium]
MTLVSNTPLGGRAGWHSLLPSKVWLTAADTLGAFAEAEGMGLFGAAGQADAPAIVERIKVVKAGWHSQQQAALAKAGVAVMIGTAVFHDSHTLTISQEESQLSLAADAFIVATGSVPVFPPTMRPNGRNVLAPQFCQRPAHLAQEHGGGGRGSHRDRICLPV